MLTINENYILLDTKNNSYLLTDDGISFELDVKEGCEYRFTGEINYSKFEKDNATLIAFCFDDFQLHAKILISVNAFYI